MRRLRVCVESGDGLGRLVCRERSVAERLERRVRHHRVGILVAKALEFVERVGAVTQGQIGFGEPVERVIRDQRIAFSARASHLAACA